MAVLSAVRDCLGLIGLLYSKEDSIQIRGSLHLDANFESRPSKEHGVSAAAAAEGKGEEERLRRHSSRSQPARGQDFASSIPSSFLLPSLEQQITRTSSGSKKPK